MRSSGNPCAACKSLRRKCTSACAFAPYFPPEQPYKFEVVHKVYGASTVARILSEVPPSERVEAVFSLVYEAEARLKDPIYGCVGYVSYLQQNLKQVLTQLDLAKQELAACIGPSAMMQVLNQRLMPQSQNQQQSVVPVIASNLEQMSGVQQPGTSLDAQRNQQLHEAWRQKLVEGAREQDMLKNLEHNQQQPQMQQSMGPRFNDCFDGAGPSGQHNQQLHDARELNMLRNLEHQHQQQLQLQHRHQQQSVDLLRSNSHFDGAGPSGQATDSGFSHLTSPQAMSPSVALADSYDSNVCQIQQQQQMQPQQEPVPQLQAQQLLQHQLMFQQQNPPSQLQQHPQQEQDHRLQQLIQHQLLLQQQNQSLQPQPQPQQEQHDHLKLPQQQHQTSQPQVQPQPKHTIGSKEGRSVRSIGPLC